MDPQAEETLQLQAVENQELEQASEVVSDHTDAMEMLHETMIGLEQVCVSFEALNEPMTPQQARFANHAYVASASRIGIQQTLPTERLFASRKVAEPATALSMETVSETLRNAWQQMVAILKRVGAAFRAFFDMVFSRQDKLADKADAQEAAAKAAEGVKVDPNEVIDMPHAGLRLMVEGKVELDDNSIRETTQQCGAHFDHLMDTASLLFASVDRLIDEASSNNAGQVSTQIAQGLDKAYDALIAKSHRNGQTHEFHGDTMPGEASWVLHVPAINDSLTSQSNPLAIVEAYASAFRHVDGHVSMVKKHGFSDSHGKIRRITPEREAQICALVKTTTGLMAARRNRWERCSKEFEAAERKFEALAKSANKSDATRLAAPIRGLIQGVSHLLKAASQITSYHLKTQSAYLTLAQELSGREHSAPAEQKAA